MPDRLKDIQEMVTAHEAKKGPLPDGVSRAIASCYNRLVFYRQKWAEVVRREEEAEQKRQQRAQRRPLS